MRPITARALNRYHAALIHLAISVVIAGATFTTIFFLWYPGALFDAAGGKTLLLLIAGVDVTLGPLLTLIVFAPGKKSLRFDLSVIALLQVAGLAYGVHVMFQARPAYIVFVRDRFELVRANELDDDLLQKARAKGFGEVPRTGPRVVGARLPTDRAEIQRLIDAALAGIDVQRFPQYYVPYSQVTGEALKAAQPVEALKKFNEDQLAAVEREIAATGRKPEELRFLPMRAGRADLAVMVDARDASVVRIAYLHPWQFR